MLGSQTPNPACGIETAVLGSPATSLFGCHKHRIPLAGLKLVQEVPILFREESHKHRIPLAGLKLMCHGLDQCCFSCHKHRIPLAGLKLYENVTLRKVPGVSQTPNPACGIETDSVSCLIGLFSTVTNTESRLRD